MNILAYKIMESFGRELMKTAAIVAVTTVAAEAASALLGRALAGPQPAPLDLSQVLSEAAYDAPAPAAPPAINVVVNVNSNNEKNSRNKDNSAHTDQTECTNVTGAEVGPQCCDGEGCEACIPQ